MGFLEMKTIVINSHTKSFLEEFASEVLVE